MDSLRRCLPGRIRRALHELPGTLDATYERTLLDIDEQNWEYAHRLFQCIAVAARPLRVEELAEFLAFDFDGGDDPRFEADWRPENPEDAVLSTCSSLIAVVNIGDATFVQFSHFSVKEFLTSNRMAQGPVSRYHILLEPAHLTITRVCLTVLLRLDGSVNKAVIKHIPLAFYAARYWIDHAKFGNVALHAQDGIQRVFDPNEPYFSAWAWLEDYDENRESISNTPSTPEVPPLHRAVRENLDHIADWLITSRSLDPDEHYGHKTPLYDASGRGNVEMAQVLIKHGADPNAGGTFGWRPLHFASNNGRLEIVRLLARSGANVNARDNDDWTPLLLATVEGHLEVVRALLETGADPNVQCWDGTPLHWALERDHLEIAQLLRQYGALNV